MSTTLKGFLKTLGVVVMLSIAAFVGTIISDETGGIDPTLTQEVIDKLIPIIMGIFTGLGTSILKTKALETTVMTSFDNMTKEVKTSYISSAENVNKVVNLSIESHKDIVELKDTFTKVLHEIKSLREEVAHVKQLETSIGNVEEMVRIAFINDPELVKNGIAKIIAKVGAPNET